MSTSYECFESVEGNALEDRDEALQLKADEANANLAFSPYRLAFDAQHPPDAKLIDACVHCGFCLSTCPSYRVLGKEMDSPRGRIYLMDGVNEGQIPLSPATVQHFDSCLGCLACVTTCPSGVRYDKLIEATRPQVERNHTDRCLKRFSVVLFSRPFPIPIGCACCCDR